LQRSKQKDWNGKRECRPKIFSTHFFPVLNNNGQVLHLRFQIESLIVLGNRMARKKYYRVGECSIRLHVILLFSFFCFLQILASTISMAQSNADSLQLYKTKYKQCEELFLQGKYDKAISAFQKLSDQFPKDVKSNVRLAELFYVKKDKTNTLYYANKAIDLNADIAYSPLTTLTNKMNRNKDDELAILILNRLSVSTTDSVKMQRSYMNREKLALQQYADRTPVPGVHLENMGDSINSLEDEYLPSISLDGNTLVFTRKVGGGNEDFFIAKRDSNQIWHKAKNMGYPPNTNMPDGAATLSADGYYLFYTRCDMRSPNGISGGGCDLAFSYREDSVWSSPQYFGETINTTAFEGQASLSSDNTDLYFVSNRPGGYGGTDIWVSHFVNTLWTLPENVGPMINTAKNESSPFIHPDNETLYFASDGQIGLGSSDLFVSRRNKNGTWKAPINLGAPINTNQFDGSLVVNAKGTKGYCTAAKANGKGGLDLYSFDLYPAIRPVPTLCLKGHVIDKYFKNNLYNRQIDFIYTYNNTTVGSINSNDGDGSYAKALQMGKTYVLQVIEDGYRPYYKTVQLMNDSLPDVINFDIKLRQPGYRDTLYKNVLKMDSTHVQLDSASAVQIDSIIKQWHTWKEDSATVVIFLKGYYYCCDSIADTLFKARVDQCQQRLDNLTVKLNKHGIKCDVIMQDMDMLIWRDDETLFDDVEVTVVEDY